VSLLVTLLLTLTGVRAAGFAHDVAWVFGDAGSSAYVLDSVMPPDAGFGTLGGQNPLLSLRFGLRYQVVVTGYTMHPLEILAMGAAVVRDTVLLSTQPGVTGTLESDASVGWEDDGAGTLAFTVSRSLTNAMLSSGSTPGYRCRAHPFSMRGSFLLIGAPLSNPFPEALAKGSTRIELVPLAAGLSAPLDLRPAPDGSGRLFVTDQAGTVRIVQDGVLLATPFLEVRGRLVAPLGILGSHDETDYDERGLLGFALHPDFANPAAPGFRKVYTYSSEPSSGLADFTTAPLTPGNSFDHQNVVAEWTVSATDPNQVDPASRRELLRLDQPQFNHNGGMLCFDQDRYLLIGCGDGGAANDVGEGHGSAGNGQDRGTVQGSLLRIDPLATGVRDATDASSRNGQYRIPATNPFVLVDGLDEIYAYGLRNPYRFSLDAPTGRLVVADVGQDHVEEITIISAGANAGWRLKEGSFRFNPSDGSVTNDLAGLPVGLLDPVAEYDHDEGSAIVGGFVYRGSALPELAGKYVFGDFSRGFTQPGGRLFTADLGTGLIEELVIGLDDRPLGLYLKGFGVDAGGELYVLGSTALGPYGTTGVVLRLAAPVLPPVQHQLIYQAEAHGSLVGTPVQTVDHGSSGTPVSAVPAPGYHFVQWSDGVTANPRTDSSVTSDLSVSARFTINLHSVRFLAAAGGDLSGTALQTVPAGGSATPVSAVASYGFVFTQWDDGVTAATRTLTDVTADVTLTAGFRPAAPAAANGSFLAIVERAAVTAGRGLWDVSGSYALTVAGNPLVLHLIHDAQGRLTGSASYSPTKATTITVPVRASVRGSNGSVAIRIVIRGLDAVGTTAMSLTLSLTVDAASRQFVGSVVGSVTIVGTTSPVATPARLDIPAPVDGTWTLLLRLSPSAKRVTGTALLALPNGVTYRFRSAGRIVGQTVVLTLSGEPSDPATQGVAIRAVVSPWEGGWAGLTAASIRGFGQTLVW
jgi:glucose/arabinose dehydrogenase